MDKEKLRQLMAQKTALDATGASLMAEVQQWKEEMLKLVGDTNFDSKSGFIWDKILLEVLKDD